MDPYARGATGKSCALRSLRCIYDHGASAPCYAPPSRAPWAGPFDPRRYAAWAVGRGCAVAMGRAATGRGRGTRSRLSGCMGCRRERCAPTRRVWAFPRIAPRRACHTQRRLHAIAPLRPAVAAKPVGGNGKAPRGAGRSVDSLPGAYSGATTLNDCISLTGAWPTTDQI